MQYKKNSRTNKNYLINNSLFRTVFVNRNDKFNFKYLSVLKHGEWNNYNNYSDMKNIKRNLKGQDMEIILNLLNIPKKCVEDIKLIFYSF